VVTGSRAEYGLIAPVIAALKTDAAFEVQLIASGMHLAPEFGLTYKQIEADGHRIDARVEMLLASDSPAGTAKSLGLGVIGFADALDRLRPELLLLAGDRFETLAAAEAALILRIPIAHLFGGDTTEGAFDEAIRHAITKMSHLHLVTHEGAAERVRQLGENPASIVVVGSPGIDALLATARLPRAEVERRLSFALRPKNLLITFHPVTLEPDGGLAELRELLSALDRLDSTVGVVFTRSNADPLGRQFSSLISDFCQRHDNAVVETSMGQQLYWSAMAQVDVVVGNSSTGLTEAPSLKKPSVDIGKRQSGRLAPASVIRCRAEAGEIHAAVKRALGPAEFEFSNPYGDGTAVHKIIAALKRPLATDVLSKRFYAVAC
jgi:UDP-N-acetylglucosamine 2-epimerase (non-hydrolysing)/GDP/UDP-N,N'-diacetylbacillosamine 2-epimerase (hydrolysing)